MSASAVALEPLSLFGRALRDSATELVAREDGGSAFALPVERWLGRAGSLDEAVLDRARGPVLDVGCGPGRHVLALQRRGVDVLGIDPAPAAIELARRRGARVHHASVFDPLPGEGRWRTALLLDGNVGIGGRPVALLRRVRALLSPAGVAIVEVGPPGSASRQLALRLQRGGQVSAAFPWATLSAADIAAVAGTARFAVTDRWPIGPRWFVELGAC